MSTEIINNVCGLGDRTVIESGNPAGVYFHAAVFLVFVNLALLNYKI